MLIAFTTDDLYCVSFVCLLRMCHSLKTSMAQALVMVKRGNLSFSTISTQRKPVGWDITSLNDKEDLIILASYFFVCLVVCIAAD